MAPFADPAVGMTTGRPVPVNDPGTFMGFAAHLLWELHHQINLRSFKAGEMIAFRKIFERIPYHTSVDEASIEPVVRGQEYEVRYVPKAVVYNKGPLTVGDFLMPTAKQLCRTLGGTAHAWLQCEHHERLEDTADLAPQP